MKESERHRRFMSTMLSELNHMFLYDKGSERFNGLRASNAQGSQDCGTAQLWHPGSHCIHLRTLF